MNKKTWVMIGILGGLFLVVGAFSAGAIVGNLIIPQPDLGWLESIQQILNPPPRMEIQQSEITTE